ncbi:iron-containing redox enzyme family protein [Aeromicrobium sp. Root495]|uniref:iron-containing redox enzyme family protein n=1 Tax=Aeromicrobium sp. Root495 TaxID=1736550 RepID=UPI001F3850BB|nr:iron-containing redox enzyme family protein [Aeromicrobium sp. Root495]
MLTPKPRGRLSEAVIDHLVDRAPLPADPLEVLDHDEDLQLALWTVYELAYRGFDDVDDAMEWDPDLLRVRRDLEQVFEAELRARCTQPETDDVVTALFDIAESDDGPSLAHHVQRKATKEQVLQLLRMRSVYHLKEADPTTWTLPRLTGRARAALVELQYDEFGAGRPDRVHQDLFARGLQACGIDPASRRLVDEAPVQVLRQNNALSLFGLHRRLRGASLGHLAAFEATSSVPSRRMARGIQRLGLPQEMADYYLEHVEADAIHEQLAIREICAPLVEGEPHLAGDVLLGAAVCVALEADLAEHLLEEWSA